MSDTAKTLARRFHDEYERLAPEFGYETREDTRTFDPESANGKLMTAVCATFADEIERLTTENEQLREFLERGGIDSSSVIGSEDDGTWRDENERLTADYKKLLAQHLGVLDRIAEPEAERKRDSVAFFRWWWNQTGTNTEQGYDQWRAAKEKP